MTDIPAATGSVFASDAFTGTANTALTTYNSAWSSGTMGGISSTGTRLTSRASGPPYDSMSFRSEAPLTADYDVRADLVQVTDQSSEQGVAARCTAATTGYAWQYRQSSGFLRLYLVNGGSYTELGRLTRNLGVETGPWRIELRLRGSTISAYVDGTLAVQVTNSVLATAGKAGVYIGGTDSLDRGYHLDNFEAQNTGPPPSVAPPQAIWIG